MALPSADAAAASDLQNSVKSVKTAKKRQVELSMSSGLSKIDGLTKPKSCTYLSEYVSSSNNI